MISVVRPYSPKGCSFFFTDTAPDASLLIADAASYASALVYLAKEQKMFRRYKVFNLCICNLT